jgi:phosphopantothenoylcysteine synthetase/decarboxylase
MMTKESEKIISPLAVSWAANERIVSDWDPEMKQLNNYDALLVAPATRNTIAKHIHGITDSPVMMSLAAARGSKTLLFSFLQCIKIFLMIPSQKICFIK